MNVVERSVVVLLCAGLVTAASAQSEFEPEHPRWLVYGCETGAGLGAAAAGTAAVFVGVAMAGIPVYLANLIINGDDGDPESFVSSWVFRAVFAAGAACMPAVSGLTVSRIGRRFDDARSTGAGIIGAYCGAAVGIGASYPLWPKLEAGSITLNPNRAWPTFLIATAGTAVGATIGYNVSRARPMETGFLGSRVGLPSVALTRVEVEDGTAAYGADLRLLTVRF